MEKKFSVLAYANKLREEGSSSAEEFRARGDRQLREFQRWTEEIRNELVTAKGRSEEEQLQYGEMLNRAVLGYEEERLKIFAIIRDQLAKRRIHDVPPPNRKHSTIAEAIFAEVIGLGELELILKEKEGLEEIQVVGTNIFEIRNGRVRPSPYRLNSVEELERIQQNLVLFNNDTLNPRKRWAEVMLRDGSRVTMTGYGYTSVPTLTIRFYTVRQFRLPELCRSEYSTMSEEIMGLLRCVFRSYFNLVVIGPTNSGKTHLMKALIAELPENERIITIESRYELMLKRDFPTKNIVEYEVHEEDVQHNGQQAFKLALRQSPKRIIHAEIRDEDANVYVRACTRGHEGSMTSVHVNELEDVPEAITEMCMMDSRGMNPARLSKRITTYVTQIGIEMAIVDGKRKVVRIGEYEFVDGEVQVRDLVVYDYERHNWHYPARFSERAIRRMQKYDREGYDSMAEGWMNRC
ncbi:ATPase, T2SS/T4P/T4SS family [Paenibacillus sp. J2TS4]|uniref:ATPase, T2SS/T4P/T4SS family n=1 Tax=Paenibacillus sp. J2TS4 TaxID=2807194 RepID=UPI001B23E18C|nr:ATPase, T2SS/T4P/T4SS family [Paenibacillus sp. J2TS4]GIP35435.1 hypothetical protein J2TS4_46450 [Paenibacillus sp. J2TS4]